MIKGLKWKVKDPLLVGSLLLIIVCLLVFVVVLTQRYFSYKSTIGETKNVVVDTRNWKEYVSEEYTVSLPIPVFLYERVYENQEGYEYMVIFGETNFSNGDGVALAVSAKSFEEEIQHTKDTYSKANAVLKKEAEIYVRDSNPDNEDISKNGERGVRLSFIPVEGVAELEAKDVAVISRKGKTYTISTTPKQMDYILQEFSFL